MNIEERKKEREKYQSENLLSIICKEVFPQKITPDKRDKKGSSVKCVDACRVERITLT